MTLPIPHSLCSLQNTQLYNVMTKTFLLFFSELNIAMLGHCNFDFILKILLFDLVMSPLHSQNITI